MVRGRPVTSESKRGTKRSRSRSKSTPQPLDEDTEHKITEMRDAFNVAKVKWAMKAGGKDEKIEGACEFMEDVLSKATTWMPPIWGSEDVTVSTAALNLLKASCAASAVIIEALGNHKTFASRAATVLSSNARKSLGEVGSEGDAEAWKSILNNLFSGPVAEALGVVATCIKTLFRVCESEKAFAKFMNKSVVCACIEVMMMLPIHYALGVETCNFVKQVNSRVLFESHPLVNMCFMGKDAMPPETMRRQFVDTLLTCASIKRSYMTPNARADFAHPTTMSMLLWLSHVMNKKAYGKMNTSTLFPMAAAIIKADASDKRDTFKARVAELVRSTFHGSDTFEGTILEATEVSAVQKEEYSESVKRACGTWDKVFTSRTGSLSGRGSTKVKALQTAKRRRLTVGESGDDSSGDDLRGDENENVFGDIPETSTLKTMLASNDSEYA